jgi:superfamily I DNA/RNA helicase
MSNKTWSDQQVAIFNWFALAVGCLIVRARAGTGKTTTIIEAIRHAPETKILLCAFNKRIAVELTEKLNDPRAEAKTLHALGFAFIRREWKNVKLDNNVEFDRATRACPGASDEVIGAVKKLAGLAKNCAPFATVDQLVDLCDDWSIEVEEQGWNTVALAQAAKRVLDFSKVPERDGRISFDDMLYIPVACNLIRPWYQMVVVDEAQDMNACQLIIAQKACKRGGRIVVVGDDRQAIYGFRGADSGSLDRLKTELKATELGLNTTYRCGQNIVALAKVLVPDYQAAPTAPMGVVDHLGYDQIFQAAKPGDFILSRKNAPLMVTCLRFLRAGIPCRVEGRDVGAGLAAVIKKFRARSVPDFVKRLDSWKEKEFKKAARRKDPEAARQVAADQYETLLALSEGAANVQEITNRCFALFEDSIDAQTGKRNLKPAVVCSSVHKAKGLEAEHVFILEDTLLRKRPDMEERNIEYVAITRAKAHLTWVKGLANDKGE